MHKKLALLAALALPSLALANPYIIAGAASGTADLSDIESYYGPGHDTDDSFTRGIIGIGADLNPNLAVEASYLTEGEVTVSDGTQTDTLTNSGVQFALLGKAPLTPQLNVFGKISANYMNVEWQYQDNLVPVNNYTVDDSKFQLGYGIGLHYQVVDNVGVRVALERIQIRDAIQGAGDSDVDQVSAGFTFGF
ncbi:MAG TPA: outer membrane beta-barrel protein [Moraxellaceae bacterium]|nr:outer membrane beta-barrel protein [Moraxellaceae bacterium]